MPVFPGHVCEEAEPLTEVPATISGAEIYPVNLKFPGALNVRYTLISGMIKHKFEERRNLFVFDIISGRIQSVIA